MSLWLKFKRRVQRFIQLEFIAQQDYAGQLRRFIFSLLYFTPNSLPSHLLSTKPPFFFTVLTSNILLNHKTSCELNSCSKKKMGPRICTQAKFFYSFLSLYPVMQYWKHINIYILPLANFPTSVHKDAEAPPDLGRASLSNHEHTSCAMCSFRQGLLKAVVKGQEGLKWRIL